MTIRNKILTIITVMGLALMTILYFLVSYLYQEYKTRNMFVTIVAYTVIVLLPVIAFLFAYRAYRRAHPRPATPSPAAGAAGTTSPLTWPQVKWAGIKKWWTTGPGWTTVIPVTTCYVCIVWILWLLFPTLVWAPVWADWHHVLVFHLMFFVAVACAGLKPVWKVRTAKILITLLFFSLLATTFKWPPFVWGTENYWLVTRPKEVQKAKADAALAAAAQAKVRAEPLMTFHLDAPVGKYGQVAELPTWLYCRGDEPTQLLKVMDDRGGEHDLGPGNIPTFTTKTLRYKSATDEPGTMVVRCSRK